MPKARAYGADARLIIGEETTYGTPPAAGNYRSMDFKSTDLSAVIPLGDDPLLGRGRDAQDPYRGFETDEGSIEVPVDLQGIGLWLKGLFGAPTTNSVAATGHLQFSAQPAAGSTITVNGVTFTFVTGTPAGNEIQIGATVDDTITNTASTLNASTDPSVSAATYTADTVNDRVDIVHDTPGPGGNAFTLAADAASNVTVSAPTLTGGGYRHEFVSGGQTIPSWTIEIGHPQLTNPTYFRHVGAVMESLAVSMGEEGPANATVNVVAQGEDKASTTLDGSPSSYSLRRFSQGLGYVKKDGASLGNVTAAQLTYSNNLERVRVIREDGRIAAADPALATAQGQMTLRFDGQTLVAEAAGGAPLSFEYGFIMKPEEYYVKFELPRVFLPKPKYAIPGPGGVEAQFDWRAAKDATAGYMLKVTLLNDVSGY